MPPLYKLLVATLLICIVLPLSVVTHEFGHAMTGQLLGKKNARIIVWPGWQIYPKFDSSKQAEWPKGAIAQTMFVPPRPNLRIENSRDYLAQNILFKPVVRVSSVSLNEKEIGLVSLMGSGLNWLLSVLALCFLMIFKNNKFMLIICTPFAFLYYDLVTYSLLPTFFDLRHWIFWGGSKAEPLLALSQFGWDHNLAVVFICTIAIVQSVSTLKVLNAQITGSNFHN
ncbi:hypothetical protein GARC_1381 [Paraglaciecola arctica BSs20135]|uniref:Peptidase M50 domain-containing protein n=2 Tax=Paraglaciecola TaxID=1621534 RepID=K6Y356_9ALTE|nr:hypothetical protein GARC_1381 [Paraglaciecola arctica BSs20135]